MRVLFALLLISGVSGCQTGANNAPATVPLSITSAGRVHRFTVEVAQTADQQERGLMFRDSLKGNAGMIFPLTPPRQASFWMKNTVIPPGIVFVRVDGSIARIANDTILYSREPVQSGEPVAAVLEIAGGRAAALGIAQDDIVSWENPLR
jgi:uncharacterized protein